MSPHSRMALIPMSSPTPLAAKAPATTRSCQISSPWGRTAVTPVRAGPLPCGSSGPPHEMVQWPTRTPGTSVMAFSGPVGSTPTPTPRSRSRQRSSPLILLLQDARAVRLEVAAAEVVFAAQRLDGLDGGHHGLVAHVEHGAVDAEARAHGHEGAVEQDAVGQAEAHVAEAAGGAHGQALLDQLEGIHRDLGGRGVGRDGHDQRVDPEVLAGQPGAGEAVRGGRRDALVAQTKADHRALVLLDEREDSVDARLLATDRVDERHLAALVDDGTHAGVEGRGAR